jgi:hypothetical protein
MRLESTNKMPTVDDICRGRHQVAMRCVHVMANISALPAAWPGSVSQLIGMLLTVILPLSAGHPVLP